MILDYNRIYSKYLNNFNDGCKRAFENFEGVPQILKDSMQYAVLDGGKRIRPVLCFATAEMLGVSCERVKEFAVAIELIHSYSLVHDDLPSMDNDDYRRGKLSTHKKFGEAYGILAGDALLNYAFEVCLNKQDFDLLDAEALKILASCAGCSGMIAGQILDLQNENKVDFSEDDFLAVCFNKTAKLIIAPLLVSSIIANKKHYNELYEFGKNLGVMFQITDDILDVEGSIESIGKTPNKDEKENKLTAIKVYGLDGAKKKLNQLYFRCKEILSKIENSEFLQELTYKIFTRNK